MLQGPDILIADTDAAGVRPRPACGATCCPRPRRVIKSVVITRRIHERRTCQSDITQTRRQVVLGAAGVVAVGVVTTQHNRIALRPGRLVVDTVGPITVEDAILDKAADIPG